MATDQQVRDWLKSNPNATDAQRRDAMDKYGVTQGQVNRATGQGPQNNPPPAAPPPSQGPMRQRGQYSDQQIRDFVKANKSKGNDYLRTATEYYLGGDHDRVANAMGLDKNWVKNAYDQAGIDRAKRYYGQDNAGLIDKTEANVRKMKGYEDEFQQRYGMSVQQAAKSRSQDERMNLVNFSKEINAREGYSEDRHNNPERYRNYAAIQNALINGKELRDVWDQTKDLTEVYKAVDNNAFTPYTMHAALGFDGHDTGILGSNGYSRTPYRVGNGELFDFYKDGGYDMTIDQLDKWEFGTGQLGGKYNTTEEYPNAIDDRALHSIMNTKYGAGQYGYGPLTPGSLANWNDSARSKAWQLEKDNPGDYNIYRNRFHYDPTYLGNYGMGLLPTEAGSGNLDPKQFAQMGLTNQFDQHPITTGEYNRDSIDRSRYPNLAPPEALDRQFGKTKQGYQEWLKRLGLIAKFLPEEYLQQFYRMY